MSLSQRDRRALNHYNARMDDEKMACRLSRRHWFPSITMYGADPDVDIVWDPVERVWNAVATCKRCGATQSMGINRRSGIVEIAAHTKLPPGYAFTEEDGGDGRPMDRERMDYLRKLRLAEAIDRKEQRAVVPFRSARGAS